jgi:hypothetical protein
MHKRLFLPFVAAAALSGACVQEDDTGVAPDGLGSEGLFDPGENGNCVPTETMGTFGLCLCDGFGKVGRLEVLEGEPGMPASVGVNGKTSVVDTAYVEGSWHAYQGFDSVTSSVIRNDVVTTSAFSWVGEQVVGGDLVVGGDVTGVGSLDVGGALRAAGAVEVIGPQSVASKGSYSAPAGPPCPCQGESFFDVAAAVDLARSANDNASIGLSSDGLLGVGQTELVLPTGAFYLDEIATVGQLRLRVEGQAALYVGGSLASVGEDSISLAAGATLDLYVSGSVATVGNVVLGNPDEPAAFRLLIGGDDGVMLNVGKQSFYGHIYAPTAPLGYVGDTEIDGSLFADRLDGVGELTIRHVSASGPPEEVCDPGDDVPVPK